MHFVPQSWSPGLSLRGTHASTVSVEGRPMRTSKAKGHASAHSLTWAAPAVYGRDYPGASAEHGA